MSNSKSETAAEDSSPSTDGAGRRRPGRTSRLLEIGSTCWRIERADRAAFIVDTADYFLAAVAAMRRAERSILILGWDFDPRVGIAPDRPGEQPDEFGRFLEHLVAERKDLRVHLLIWDLALPIAIERRMIPQRTRHRFHSDRIQYRLDDAHPAGASHHQKILVVDDAIAFCGGMDFAGNRWDTSDHADHDPRRRTPDGDSYAPRHDVMMAVDGAAASALGDLARERWYRATGVWLQRPVPAGDPWPATLEPDMAGVTVGISRTEPAWKDRQEIRENEALHLKTIAAARRWIYMESQYFASACVTDALAVRLAEPDGPEAVVVLPIHSPSYFDRLAMDPVRDHLIRRLRAADRHGRFRAYAPLAAGGTPIVVHSKVTIVDGRLLRIGSANLNNRSMGFDTECDLAVEAIAGEPRADRTGEGTLRFLDRLLTEHLGASPGQLGAALARTGSLIAGIEALNRGSGRRLQAIDTSRSGGVGTVIAAGHLMDPLGTADVWRPWKRHRRARRVLRRQP